MTSRIFKVWAKRVECDDVWEHSIIRQWCKAVHQLAYEGVASGHFTSLQADEADELLRLFRIRWPGEYDGPRVTEPQAQLGRHWLATTGKRLGLDLSVDPAEITHFTFVGGKVLQTGAWPYTTPVYVAWWPDGAILRYWATPWQDHADMEWMFARHPEHAL